MLTTGLWKCTHAGSCATVVRACSTALPDWRCTNLSCMSGPLASCLLSAAQIFITWCGPCEQHAGKLSGGGSRRGQGAGAAPRVPVAALPRDPGARAGCGAAPRPVPASRESANPGAAALVMLTA